MWNSAVFSNQSLITFLFSSHHCRVVHFHSHKLLGPSPWPPREPPTNVTASVSVTSTCAWPVLQGPSALCFPQFSTCNQGTLGYLPTGRQEQQPLRPCCLCVASSVILPSASSIPVLLHLRPRDVAVQMSTLESSGGHFSASVEVTVITWACKLTDHVKTLKRPGREETHAEWTWEGCVHTLGKAGKCALDTEVKGIHSTLKQRWGSHPGGQGKAWERQRGCGARRLHPGSTPAWLAGGPWPLWQA